MANMAKNRASANKAFDISSTAETLLSAEQRQQCINFMDAARASLAPDSADIKITLGRGADAFNALFQLDSDANNFAR